MKSQLKNTYLQMLQVRYKIAGLTNRPKKKNVLFISTFEEGKESIKRNISSYIYNVKEINPKTTSMSTQIKLIRRANVIYIDNYYAPLAVLNLKNKTVVQLWHANGAVKKFGLASPKNIKQSSSNISRYKKVYQNVDIIPIASDQTKEDLKQAFGIEDDSKFMKIGYHQMDQYFGAKYHNKVEQIIATDEALLTQGIILYVPTFRDTMIENQKQIDFIETLAKALGKNMRLFYRLHPNVEVDPNLKIKGATKLSATDLKYYYSLANLVITDYSSTLYDAALLNKPLAFYVYDFENYENEQGLFLKKKDLPGYVTTELDEIIEYVLDGKYEYQKTVEFSKKYNEYNRGFSGRKLVLETLREK